jgi:imidazole glycerol-phosphate synthase subunit HisH
VIVIIDYGMGNLGTVAAKVKKMATSVVITSDPEEISHADKIILPGVGSFKAGMENLRSRGLITVLDHKVLKDKTPILGICLGMQLFTRKSEEGFVDGLGWIDAETIRFRFQDSLNGLKIPHMGWNTLTIKNHHPIFKDLGDRPRFYFVHSYHAQCSNSENVAAQTEYGYPFPSVITRENITGVQFHPERSHKFGMKILKNFIEG